MTYQALIHRLDQWAAAHPMVVRFTDGELEIADLDKDSPTPHVHAQLLGVAYSEHARTYDVEIYSMTLYREDGDEALAVREALNNTLLIMEDLVAEVRNGFQSFGRLDVNLLLPLRPTPFIQEHNRVLVGFQGTMSLETPFDANACDSPINETGIPSIACPAASITTNGDSPALEVASGASQDIAVHDTAAADVGSRSGATVTIADTTVTVNSSAYGTTVAESTLNVEVVDDGDSPVGSLSGGKWVVPAGSGSVGATLMKTGQTISYAAGDDGDLEAGRATDFFTIASNNPFGHTFRFTGTTGGYSNDPENTGTPDYRDSSGVATTQAGAFPDGVAIDWSTFNGTTVLGYHLSMQGADTWTDAIAAANGQTVGAYSSGWRLPNMRELFNAAYFNSGRCYNYAPFLLSGNNRFWSGTRNPNYLGATHANAMLNQYQFGIFLITIRWNWFACRNFTVTGTTLT